MSRHLDSCKSNDTVNFTEPLKDLDVEQVVKILQQLHDESLQEIEEHNKMEDEFQSIIKEISFDKKNQQLKPTTSKQNTPILEPMICDEPKSPKMSRNETKSFEVISFLFLVNVIPHIELNLKIIKTLFFFSRYLILHN